MVKSIRDTTILNNGVHMPWFGLGVYKAKAGKEVENAVHHAIELGYRSIDTAALYENEASVGQAVRSSGLKREEIFLTTKVWNTDQGFENTLRAFETSRKKLNVDYVDLYLIHWPGRDKFKDTWRALEKLYREKYIRAIGVSNFDVHHLQTLAEDAEFTPAVNQVEYHPRLTQKAVHQYCKEQKIQLEAWGPLMRGRILDHPLLVELAAKYGKTPAQIVLRWDLDTEVVTIPKSVHRDRLEENANVFDFTLSQADIERIRDLNQDERTGFDPNEFLF
ncbi:aldo/keto reductase [Alicyclobacillus fodiniaquatilis]|uniref:Aldo/keto reductase n=1 Tax=Alicyclobacillus fodiniaquatilis TaxID=1661150 RepID=A0ABW4JMK0_9BACL